MFNKILIVILIIVYTIQSEYGAIIDAGSSGSRLYIYTWDDRVSKDVTPKLSIPITESNWNKRIKPGFTDFANDPAGLEAHLNECLDFGREFFQNLHISTDKIPLFFYATAGARLLESGIRNELMDRVRSILSKSGFYFKEIQCKIISGEEEGLFGWLSVNYLKGTLFTPDTSYGTLEMGGASTQIALYYTKDILANIYNFNLNSINYQMYIHSYLKYGINEAMMLSHIKVFNDRTVGPDPLEIVHPCFPFGKNFSYIHENKNYTLWGNGNYATCKQISHEILNIDADCNVGPCSFATAYQPSFEKDSKYKFIAFSAFDSVRNVLKKDDVKVSELDTAARKYCAMTLAEIKAEFPGDLYSYQFCFYFNYVSNLFLNGFRFDGTKTITFPGTIDGQSISWTTGAMLIQTNLLPITYDIEKESNRAAIIALGVVAGILFLVVIVFCFILFRGSNKQTVTKKEVV